MKGKKMRYIIDCNPNKRGCYICADITKIKCNVNGNMVTRKCCPYDKCPYYELDDVKCYSDYDKLAKKQGRSLLEEWLKKVFNVSEKYIVCQKST